MLAAVNRLKETNDYKKAKKKGIVFQSESFGLVVYDRGNKKPSRFGFIISTKISKEAVVRNKTRRSLSEAIRQNLVYIKPGFDCIFLAKQIVVKKYTDELMKEVERILVVSGLNK